MLRVAQRLTSRQQYMVLQNVRHQSTAQRKSGGGTLVLLAAGGVTAGVVGAFGYASWSDENRKAVDDNIPGMSYLTDAVLGKAYTPVTKISPSVIKPKIESSKDAQSGSLMQAKVEREKKQKEKESKKEETKPPEVISTPSTSVPVASSDKKVPAKDTDTRLAPTPSVVPGPTSVALTAAANDANKSVTAALQAAEEAAEVVRKQILDAAKDLGQGNVSDYLKSSVGAVVTSAEDAFDKAQNCVSKLADCVIASKSDGSASSDSIALAEQTTSELVPAMNQIKAVIADSINSMLTFETLNGALQEAKSKLSSELKELLPDVSNMDAEKQLQLMLGQAYLKIATMQKFVADQQKSLADMHGRVVTQEEAGPVSGDIQDQLDRLRHVLTLQHKSDLGRQKEELEAEVRGQLKRQAAAHSEHLNDMLLKKEQDVTKLWQAKLFDEIIKEKDRHLKEIASVKGKVLGLKTAVEGRADADRAAHSARRLWLACNSLRNTLRMGREGASNFDSQLEPLDKHIAAISVAGVNDAFVQTIVDSLSGVPSERGVYTEEALKHRFLKVSTIAKRVALVPENGGSLLRYLLSYLQSVMIVEASPKSSEAMLFDEPVDIDSLNTFDIIDRARICLATDDLTGCIRCLNQLTGESRNIAKDWCLEARRTLEAKQAADALMAHAATVTVKAV